MQECFFMTYALFSSRGVYAYIHDAAYFYAYMLMLCDTERQGEAAGMAMLAESETHGECAHVCFMRAAVQQQAEVMRAKLWWWGHKS